VSSLLGRGGDGAQPDAPAAGIAADGAMSLSASPDEALGRDETFAPPAGAADANSSPPARRFADRYVERITLRNRGVSPLSLFQRSAIQEPTFEELVILFRFATPS